MKSTYRLIRKGWHCSPVPCSLRFSFLVVVEVLLNDTKIEFYSQKQNGRVNITSSNKRKRYTHEEMNWFEWMAQFWYAHARIQLNSSTNWIATIRKRLPASNSTFRLPKQNTGNNITAREWKNTIDISDNMCDFISKTDNDRCETVY